jgi:hypothetical protein
MILSAPCIVDSRPTEIVKLGSGFGFKGVVMPFPLFTVELPCDSERFSTAVVVMWADKGEVWDVNMAPILSDRKSRPGVVGSCAFRMTRDGEVQRLESDPSRIGMRQHLTDEAKEFGRINGVNINDWMAWEVRACLDTLQLLGCNNVSLKPHDNEPSQVRRAIKRMGGTPETYRYHTLVVRAPGARSDAPAQEIGSTPRHVCRGHFAEYGPAFSKGLLFGKYEGRFYVPPHLKGRVENGVVDKDYAIR